MRFTYLLVLLFLSAVTFAQEGFKGEHFIEVSGVAETEIDPNQITVFIKLKEFEENKSKVTLEKLDQDFLAALKAAGIDKKRLTLADAGSNLGKLGRKDKDAFREKSYEVTLTSAAELEKFIEKVEPVKVQMLRVTRIHHSEMEKFKTEVKIKALQVAKTKAEALTRAIGSDIGKPLMIREWENEPVYPMANVAYKAEYRTNMDTEPFEDQEDSAIAFKKIRLRAQITAQFEIK
jgi:uncharacterized protein